MTDLAERLSFEVSYSLDGSLIQELKRVRAVDAGDAASLTMASLKAEFPASTVRIVYVRRDMLEHPPAPRDAPGRVTGLEIETRILPLNELPPGRGWNIWSGNERQNAWWRLVNNVGGQKLALVHSDVWSEVKQ